MTRPIGSYFSSFPTKTSRKQIENKSKNDKNDSRIRARNEPEQMDDKIAGQPNTQIERSLNDLCL
jgi:hypothetical protein